MAVLLDEAGNPLTDESGAQLLDEAGGAVSPPSMFPISITVELLINGTWVDVSAFVYYRDKIVIGGGKAQNSDTAVPATMRLTFNNRDGRFSPAYTGGAYYPFLARNTRIRASVTATSTTGNYYSGFRFTGEVPEWPPSADLSGTDVFVPVVASGPLRRLRGGGGKGSALTRYYAGLTGAYSPIAYWPCEEDPDATILGPGIDGGTTMTVTAGKPTFKAVSDFNGSAPIAVMNNSTWDGLTGSFGSSGDDIFTVPGVYPWIASTPTVDARFAAAGGGGLSGGILNGNAGGGGGESAQESALAVTPGQLYMITIGAGGKGSSTTSVAGKDGGDSFMPGDAVTIRSHGGQGAQIGNIAGNGGTGSTNTAHHDGGAGAARAGSDNGGAGGGSSGGLSAAGNPGSPSSGNTGGGGGAAVTGGGPGGRGGDGGGGPNSNGHTPVAPGGGGGGGGQGAGGGGIAGNGAAGRAELIYTPQTVPNANVVRFILLVPAHGGNRNKALIHALTSGTIATIEVSVNSTSTGLVFNGKLSGGTTAFSGTLTTPVNGVLLLVSAELATSGANVAWKLTAIRPGIGQAPVGTVSGTYSTATVGNVIEVLAGPNADVTKTAIGHISVQYALISVAKVSAALDGHHAEMGVDRLIRLCNEQALDNAVEFAESSDHWGFETGTQGWTAANAVLSSSADTAAGWPAEGSHSLRLSATGEGQPSAASPAGTSGHPVNPGDRVALAVDVFAPAGLGSVYCGLKWYNSGGIFISESDAADTAITASTVTTITHKATAPSAAAFFAMTFGNHHADTAGTLLYGDRARTHPRMGAQTRKEFHRFLEEIKDLDQGILAEARELWGFRYRTRFRLINQTPALTLDNSLHQLADPRPLPVLDDKNTKNHIVVHRHKGSKVTVTLDTGTMSVQEPPAGAGRKKHLHRVIAEEDEQLLALASHLLSLGTVQDERYPVVTVNLFSAHVADLVSAIAGVEIGDFIRISNLPFWYPQATAKQLVIGYTETITQDSWAIQWNCTPESCYEITAANIRRW